MAKPTSIKPGKRLSVSTVEARGSLKGSSRRGKYNAAGRRVDGAWFASEAEAVRYEQLRSLLADGVIERLELQPKFPVLLNGVPITTYRADFRYAVLNERGGAFNRNSLVLYAMERLPDGSIQEHGYAFTEPAATRIGNNLKWMLVNCAITPRDEARPEL